jgi:hypothetical protein
MNIFAFTQPGASYPGFLSVNRLPNGDVEIHLRAEPTVSEGRHICAHARDAGPGRCVAGGPTCNNYCNMAPEKGPMQDAPLPATHVTMGSQARLIIPAAEWDRLLSGG